MFISQFPFLPPPFHPPGHGNILIDIDLRRRERERRTEEKTHGKRGVEGRKKRGLKGRNLSLKPMQKPRVGRAHTHPHTQI